MAATLSIDVAAASHAKALPNEDAFLVDADHLLFGVFDGLGSMTQSAFAARLAAVAIAAAYDHRPRADCAAEQAFLGVVTEAQVR